MVDRVVSQFVLGEESLSASSRMEFSDVPGADRGPRAAARVGWWMWPGYSLGDLDRCAGCDPVATAPGTEWVTQ